MPTESRGSSVRESPAFRTHVETMERAFAFLTGDPRFRRTHHAFGGREFRTTWSSGKAAGALCAAIVIAAGCATPPAHVSQATEVSGGVEAPAWTPRAMPYGVAGAPRGEADFAFATDPFVAAMGLPPLREATLPAGMDELRAWIGFGVFIPNTLLRLTDDGEAVLGELIYWYDLSEHPSADSVWTSFHQEMVRATGGAGCIESHTGMEWTSHDSDGTTHGRSWLFACRIDFDDRAPDWGEVRSRLRAMGAYDLPDPSTLSPAPTLVLDGISIQVEALEAGRHHTYMYDNPSDQPWPEAETAMRIMRLIAALEPASQ